MASHRGLLPASKEIVLEIQLNKLIHDFLFSEVDNGNTSSVRNGDAEGQDASWNVGNRLQNKPWKVEESLCRKMDNPSCLSLENANLSENVSILPHAICATGASNMLPGNVDAQSFDTRLSDVLDECKDMPNNNRCFPITGEVRLDIPEQTSNLCDVEKPQHPNKVKVFRFSKSNSVTGSLFCFAMERRGENKEKDNKGRATGGSIKLTRVGSLPCHSKLRSEADMGSKHTCQKPPRPPRSPLEKSSHSVLTRHASSDAILVLRGTSRRARLERRKRLTGSSSSNASIWALIFTLFFALAMLGEGFWSLNSPLIATDSSFNTTAAISHMNSNSATSSVGRAIKKRLVSSQLEKEIQMREFWISKGLDPT